ncbi:O-antigen ligase family protein [Peribacillus butanolivorans]|uniref:O-antigen ligase family protein n=1 Tax=Peribacillus butanolivorans TaxID=421767 RepID=UPI0036597D37
MSVSPEMSSKKRKVEYLFIFTSCYSVIIQFFLMNGNIYSILRYILIFLIILIFFVLILTKQLKIKNNLIIGMILVSYITLILGLIYSIIFNTIIIENTLFIPLLLIIIGYNLNLHLENRNLLIYCYAFSTLLVGWYIVLKFGNGFSISSQYFLAQKNQLGAIIGVSISMLLYLLFTKKAVFKNRIFFTIMLIFLNIIPLFLLRNRTTMLAVIICLVFIIIKTLLSTQASIFAKFLIVCLILLLFSSSTTIDFIYNSFFLNVDVTDINSLSSDRVSVYSESIEFIKNNFWFGEVATESNIFDPHNFFIYNLLKNGILLSFGSFIFYFIFLRRLIKSWFSVKLFELNVSNFLLIISFSASMLEYQQPFGPGTTQLLAWFFVGNELREGRNNGKKN